jgi:hypothetical protein
MTPARKEFRQQSVLARTPGRASMVREHSGWQGLIDAGTRGKDIDGRRLVSVWLVKTRTMPPLEIPSRGQE